MKYLMQLASGVSMLMLSLSCMGQNRSPWQMTLGGTESETFQALIKTSDGGTLVLSNSLSDITGTKTEDNIRDASNNVTADYWVTKLDAEGNIEWDRTLGGTNQDMPTCLADLGTEGYLIGGYSNSNAYVGIGSNSNKSDNCYGGMDYWVLKLDVNGMYVWDETYDYGNRNGSANKNDYLFSMTTVSSGTGIEVVLAGITEMAAGSGVDRDLWLLKINPSIAPNLSGHITSNTNIRYGGTGDEFMNLNVDVSTTAAGKFLVACSSESGATGNKTTSNNGGYDYWVLKLDNNVTLSKLWESNIGGTGHDYPTCVTEAGSGDILICGLSYSGILSGQKSEAHYGSGDYWIVILNSTGTKIWDKTLGGTSEDLATNIIETDDGRYITVGNSLSDATGNKTVPRKNAIATWARDIWAVGIEPAFINTSSSPIVCQLALGGPYGDMSWFSGLVEDTDGGFILGASSTSEICCDRPSNNCSVCATGDTWIIKFSDISCENWKTPDVEWDKVIGGTSSDKLGSMIVNSNGDYVLAGISNSVISGNKTGEGRIVTSSGDYWIVKLSSDGSNILWQNVIGGTGADAATSIIQTSDGGYMVAGISGSQAGYDKSDNAYNNSNDIWLTKLDQYGAKSWDVTIGGDANDGADAVIRQTSDGGYIVTTCSESNQSGDKSDDSYGGYDYWILKLDQYGAIEWQKTYGGTDSDVPYDIIQSSDGGYLVAGLSNSGVNGNKTASSKGMQDIWVIKLESDGDLEWQKTYGGSSSETIRSITEAVGGGFFLAGISSSPISGDKTEASRGNSDAWLVKTEADGDIIWDKTIGGSTSDSPRSIAQHGNGSIALAISSSSGASLSSPVREKKSKNRGGTDYWMVLLSSSGNLIWEKDIASTSNDEVKSVHFTSDNGFVLGGYSNSPKNYDKSQNAWGADDYWIVKLKGPCVDAPMPAPEPLNDPAAAYSMRFVNADYVTTIQTPVSKEEFSIYPNPATTGITINCPAPVRAVMTDVAGRIVACYDINKSLYADMHQFPDGIYFLTCKGYGTRKIVKVSAVKE